MATGDFVHCHAHSQYSLLDGASRVRDMIARAADCGMPAMAVTDHGVMYGAIEFYKEAKAAGIKPLIGMEAYVAFGDRRERSPARTGKHYGHLVLIAKDQQGYENLVRLNTIGHLEGYYHKPRIDREVLAEYHEGLVALSACIGGQVPQMVLQNRWQDAEDLARWYQGLFGDDFYLEVQDHGLPDQHKVNAAFRELSERLGIKLAATNDSHFTRSEDQYAHDALICIGTGQTANDPNRKMAYGEHFYIKSAEEMYEVFHDIPEACRATLEIAEKCHLDLELGRTRLPMYQVPDGHTAETYLVELAAAGLRRRYADITPALEGRLGYELGIITQMGFPAYFLIVWDFISWAKSNGIPVGPGRGSAAGSLVAYCLGITDLDPVRYNLLFERFLNPERVSMPDIDVDFCIDRRGEVIKYVREKYGEDRVSQIVTFNTMKAKAAIKDVARVMGLSFTEANDLCKKVPDELNITLEDATAEGTELAAEMGRNEKARTVIEMAKRLEGLTRNSSVHAAGVVISEEPLASLVPLTRLDRDKDSDAGLVTQYEMKYLEMLGLLKMDFLGLRNLTMIGRALDMIETNHGVRIDFSDQDFSDPQAYELMRAGDTVGIFQVESEGMTKLIRQLQPTCFEDISAVLALFRPGPLETGYVKKYVDRKHGREKVEYPHPKLESILGDTYGTMVYQEQIMQIAQELAGYTLGGADLLRRAMSKKKADEMAEQRAIFLAGCAERGVDETIASSIFDDMEKFSEYCFNRAHTAAYAVLTYQTAYLKAHYPSEYMAALLSSWIGTMDRIQLTVHDCRHMGIAVLPPDVNSSGADFTVVPEGIRFGLGAIKNVGLGAVEEIVRQRSACGGRFKDPFEFFEKCDGRLVNKRCIESLVACGAFDSFEPDFERSCYLGANLDALMEWAGELQKGASAGQFSLFAGMEDVITPPRPHLLDLPSLDPAEALRAEKDLIGLYLSGHPLEHLPTRLDWHTTATAKNLETVAEPRHVVVGGLVHSCRKILTRRGDMMMTGKVDDFTGTIDWVMFPKAFETCGSAVADDAKVLLKGKYSKGNDDRQQLEVEAVWELGGLVSCHLNLPQGADGAFLVGLKEALKAHRGDVPVVLHFDGRTDEVVVGDAFWVDRTPELQRSLERKLEDPARITWHEPRPLLAGVP